MQAQRFDNEVPECFRDSLYGHGQMDKQSVLVEKLVKLRVDALKNNTAAWDREGVASLYARAWLDAPPCLVQDVRTTDPEVLSRSGRWLGVALCEEMACPLYFCAES